jgi:hypothetical protein
MIENNLATGLLRGQLEHESSWRLGNYSMQYGDRSYDAGVAQRNTNFTAAKDGFNAPESIDALAVNIRQFYDKYAGVSEARRWGLAAGAWNAPAYASWLANEAGAHVPRNQTKQPSAAAREKLEAYIASVTAYLTL